MAVLIGSDSAPTILVTFQRLPVPDPKAKKGVNRPIITTNDYNHQKDLHASDYILPRVEIMSQLQERIAQFRKMASDDPDNELGHFRLGQLLMEDGQFDEATSSFRRTLELSPLFSKVYQLLGESLLKLGNKDEAIQVLWEGHKVAGERGDRIPQDAIAKLLRQQGEEVTAEPLSEPPVGAGPTGFRCTNPNCRAGNMARQLPGPPIPEEIGMRIHQEICAQCWDDWFRGMSIKVINELRLDLSSDNGQKEYDRYMRENFGFEDESA